MRLASAAAAVCLALIVACGSNDAADPNARRGDADGSAGGMGGATAPGAGGAGVDAGGLQAAGGSGAGGAGGVPGSGGMIGSGGTAGAGISDAGSESFSACPLTGAPLRSTPCIGSDHLSLWYREPTGDLYLGAACEICASGADTSNLPCVAGQLCVASCSSCASRP